MCVCVCVCVREREREREREDGGRGFFIDVINYEEEEKCQWHIVPEVKNIKHPIMCETDPLHKKITAKY